MAQPEKQRKLKINTLCEITEIPTALQCNSLRKPRNIQPQCNALLYKCVSSCGSGSPMLRLFQPSKCKIDNKTIGLVLPGLFYYYILQPNPEQQSNVSDLH